MALIIAILSLWFIHWAFLGYVNCRAMPLINSLKNNAALYEEAGAPSKYYFWLEFIHLNYNFAWYLWKNPRLSDRLGFDDRKYRVIRNLSNSLLLIDMARIATLVLGLFFYQFIMLSFA